MTAALLNGNQARHVTTVLGLLLDDLNDISSRLPPGAWADAVHAGVTEVRHSVMALLGRLGLDPPPQPRPGQRLVAYAGIWLARLHDLRAPNLSGYGPVAVGLGARLHPGLDEISRVLERLAALGAAVSEK